MGHVNPDYLTQEYNKIRNYILDITVKTNKTNLAVHLDNLQEEEIDKKGELLEEAEKEIKDALFKLYEIYDDNSFDKKYSGINKYKGTIVTWKIYDIDSEAWEFYVLNDTIILKLKRDWVLNKNEEQKKIEKEWINNYIKTLIDKLKKVKDKYTIEYIK